MDPEQELLGALRSDKSQSGIQRAMRRFFQAADANAVAFQATKGISLACGRGCDLCCVFRVHLRAHEVFTITNYIEEKFTSVEREQLKERLESHAIRIAPMSRKQHESTNVPCPLLIGSECSVYPVRPFACRGHHSTDLSACQYSYEHPEDIDFPGSKEPELEMLWRQMAAHAHITFEEVELDKQEYELGTAILAALRNPASVRRWRDGKNPLLSQNQ